MQRKMQFTSHGMRLLFVGLLLSGQVWAQQTESPSDEPPPTRSSRVRLPAYFAAVVTPTQREEVYKIQMLYLKQISELQTQIAELEKKRDQEVDGALTKEQLAEVQKRRDAAASRRRSRARPTEDGVEASPESTR